jgi:hypothetical protein
MTFFEKQERTESEQALLRAVETGKLVDLRTGDADVDNPASGLTWGHERTVPSELLYTLLAAGHDPTPRAVVLRGALISGGLNLEAAKLACPLVLEGCFFDGPINLRGARAEVIRITGCQLPCLAAERLETLGSLELDRSTFAVVDLMTADIGGQ